MRTALPDHLDAALRDAPRGALVVGFSGGIDSTALLHALASLPAARERGLRALHVDHGLHADAPRWAEQCAAFAQQLSIDCAVVRVQVDAVAEFGLEGAARRARHAAFAAQLRDGELLALAHHRDDQAETVLLRLLHGAGAEGLAGMRALRSFAAGWLWRPLLDLGRDALIEYARAHGLAAIDDPADASPRFARNHLRHAVLPALQSRWPDAAQRIAAAAARLREESDALLAALPPLLQGEGRGEDGFRPARHTIAIDTLHHLAPALRRLAIGLWLDSLRLPRPPPGIWSQIDPLLHARADAAPLLQWRGAELRRYRGHLYAMRPLRPAQIGWSIAWDGVRPLELPAGFGTLQLEPASATIDAIVHPRRGGERLAQAGAHRELRTLLQDLGVPPWIRERLPLLAARDGTLLAAADLALAPAFAAHLAQRGQRLHWRRPAD